MGLDEVGQHHGKDMANNMLEKIVWVSKDTNWNETRLVAGIWYVVLVSTMLTKSWY